MLASTPVSGPPQRNDHDALRLGLMSAGLRVWDARDSPVSFPRAHDDLVRFCITEVLPHLEADESWLLEEQRHPQRRLLAEAMRAEVRTMTATVDELPSVAEPCEAMALTRVLHAFLAAHDHHEKLLLTAASSA